MENHRAPMATQRDAATTLSHHQANARTPIELPVPWRPTFEVQHFLLTTFRPRLAYWVFCKSLFRNVVNPY